MVQDVNGTEKKILCSAQLRGAESENLNLAMPKLTCFRSPYNPVNK